MVISFSKIKIVVLSLLLLLLSTSLVMAVELAPEDDRIGPIPKKDLMMVVDPKKQKSWGPIRRGTDAIFFNTVTLPEV